MRWIFRILGVIIGLVVLAVAALYLVPADRIARLAETRFEAATGRALSVEGDVRPALWPEIGVTTGAITIANANWSDDGPMIAAEALSVGVDLFALIGGETRITGIEITAPRILLQTGPDGRGNWEIAAPAAGSVSSGDGDGAAAPAFTLDRAVITDGSVSYIDAAGARTDLTAIDATFALPGPDQPADLTLTASMNGQPVSVEGRVARAAAFLSGDETGAQLTVTAGDARIGFDGQAGLGPLAATGALDADLGDPAALAALAGQPAPDLPRGLGRESAGLSGQLDLAGATLSLRGMRAALDQNVFTGTLDLDIAGARPRLVADLTAGDVDLSAMATGGGATADATGATTGWSKDPIDLSGLGALDAQISLAADSLALGDTRLQRTRLFTSIDNARMVTEIRELNAYDGTVAGNFVVNARQGLSVSTDLNGSAIAISRLLSELVGYDRLIAAGDLRVSALGVGGSMDAIMNSLDGEGSFEIGAGELLGLDIVGMLRNLDTSFLGTGSRTIFDSITGTFQIVDGVVINDNLSVLAPLFKATGAGQVGLGAQSLNFRLVPELLAGEGAGLKVPLMVTGTWSSPKFRLDLEALARERIDAETTDRLRETVGEELGLTPQDGQSLEDAAKEKLEDEAKRGLLKLLGRD